MQSTEQTAATKDLLARLIKLQQRQSDRDRLRRNIQVGLIAFALVAAETGRRGARLTATPESPYFRDSWMGEEALALGLVDAQCTIDLALASLGAPHLREFAPRASLIDRLTEQIAARAAGVLQYDAAPRPMTLR